MEAPAYRRSIDLYTPSFYHLNVPMEHRPTFTYDCDRLSLFKSAGCGVKGKCVGNIGDSGNDHRHYFSVPLAAILAGFVGSAKSSNFYPQSCCSGLLYHCASRCNTYPSSNQPCGDESLPLRPTLQPQLNDIGKSLQ